MIIGVDIDNVIADTEKELRRVLLERRGLDLTREDIKTYTLENVAGITRQDLKDIMDLFNHGEIFTQLEVIEGARETLELLKVRHRIELVTSRPSSVERQTLSWLERHGIPFDDLIFSGKSKVGGTQYELFFEDQENFAIELADEGTYVLLFDAPWNRHVEHENMCRVHSWQDVYRFCFPPCALGH
ncbi:MAG: hypothetical protein HZA22_03275 [Nitrospirae bacterium]|nr:hypothetical protein [Nitrospirota bacterium]MBI5695770.1 hypothetical protein [Nitrospirota bacterium]